MLRKLRRSSKDSIPEVAPGSRHDRTATHSSYPSATDANKLTFFDLPPELRNAIYEILATNTILTLTGDKKRSKDRPPIVGLLAASKQCRKEYLPVLFSTTPVVAEIKDFDFSNLMRVVLGLYSQELKALRENPHITIQLHTHNCTRENLNNLRRWLVVRGDSLDRLPWHYDVAAQDPGHSVGRIRLLRELEFYAERLARLQSRLSDTLQWELQPMVMAFDRKAAALDNAIMGVEKGLDVDSRNAARRLPSRGQS
ncbi:hypothetical protein KC332_g10357 [Hortaea werneckii]|uniref:F-box domain-containing protein n=1 Tax=Hortaea werneckii TaxID=91943 RepID=A0A3M7HET3_HORWE|nr:hypothetical protein KC350_g18657 [Hortaea werneckii]KAI6787756.1 hypothetical protein KC358_g18639 [Hortaea werneckii]KAI6904401.1 hypothetical protein KC348_g15346 [Hortaea werneckii]KAI6917706.1 hypothetical protein KC341_g18377 [Hortaea werneckii]KAI6950632.1 hypothetical protein KC321_g18317 [Hortaea werneckii]